MGKELVAYTVECTIIIFDNNIVYLIGKCDLLE